MTNNSSKKKQFLMRLYFHVWCLTSCMSLSIKYLQSLAGWQPAVNFLLLINRDVAFSVNSLTVLISLSKKPKKTSSDCWFFLTSTQRCSLHNDETDKSSRIIKFNKLEPPKCSARSYMPTGGTINQSNGPALTFRFHCPPCPLVKTLVLSLSSNCL